MNIRNKVALSGTVVIDLVMLGVAIGWLVLDTKNQAWNWVAVWSAVTLVWAVLVYRDARDAREARRDKELWAEAYKENPVFRVRDVYEPVNLDKNLKHIGGLSTDCPACLAYKDAPIKRVETVELPEDK